MSSLHNELRQTDLQRGVARAFGGEVQLERVGETLTPIYNPWERFEYRLLRGEYSGFGRIVVVAGGAGNLSQAQLFNTSTNMLITVERVMLLGDGVAISGGWSLGYSKTAMPTGPSSEYNVRDLRSLKLTTSPPHLVGYIYSRNNSINPHGSTLWTGNGLVSSPGTPYTFDLPLVLPPGWGLCATTDADTNVSIIANFAWRERLLNPGEFAAVLD